MSRSGFVATTSGVIAVTTLEVAADPGWVTGAFATVSAGDGSAGSGGPGVVSGDGWFITAPWRRPVSG
jgi:hypothetical protein